MYLGATRWRVLDAVEPQALSITHWFRAADAAARQDAVPVEIRVTGRRRADAQQPAEYADIEAGASRKHLDEVYRLDTVVPPEGIVAWTVRTHDVAPGVWDLTATATCAIGGRPPDGIRQPGQRVRLTGPTVYAPLAKNAAPGARVGAWPMLVAVGAVAGLWIQNALAQELGLASGLLTVLSVIACLLGVVGAKAYYLLTHPDERRSVLTTGMSVQGFVIAALGSLAIGARVSGLPLGAVLDASAPALLIGLTIGRLGCFLGGCCVGRPTASRWGIWSSDRTLGVRRIPVQLLESLTAAVLFTVTLFLILVSGTHRGLVFVAGLAAYIAARQILFPLRATPRATRHGRSLTLWLASVAFVVAAGLLAAGG
jgi:phosphatidylglycerol:prolipoprotein diacylglycerol transferase